MLHKTSNISLIKDKKNCKMTSQIVIPIKTTKLQHIQRKEITTKHQQLVTD